MNTRDPGLFIKDHEKSNLFNLINQSIKTATLKLLFAVVSLIHVLNCEKLSGEMVVIFNR